MCVYVCVYVCVCACVCLRVCLRVCLLTHSLQAPGLTTPSAWVHQPLKLKRVSVISWFFVKPFSLFHILLVPLYGTVPSARGCRWRTKLGRPSPDRCPDDELLELYTCEKNPARGGGWQGDEMRAWEIRIEICAAADAAWASKRRLNMPSSFERRASVLLIQKRS